MTKPVSDGTLPAKAAAVPLLVRVDARAALERTLLALLPRVRMQLFRMLGPRAALEDAVQDALIELARALPRYEGRASLETFARTVTLRVGYRYFSRETPPAAFDPERHPSDEPAADEELAERQALARLHRCLARLPAKRRTAFILCAIEELSPLEAAALVGSSQGAMRARYMHARDELARMLGGPRGEGEHG